MGGGHERAGPGGAVSGEPRGRAGSRGAHDRRKRSGRSSASRCRREAFWSRGRRGRAEGLSLPPTGRRLSPTGRLPYEWGGARTGQKIRQSVRESPVPVRYEGRTSGYGVRTARTAAILFVRAAYLSGGASHPLIRSSPPDTSALAPRERARIGAEGLAGPNDRASCSSSRMSDSHRRRSISALSRKYSPLRVFGTWYDPGSLWPTSQRSLHPVEVLMRLAFRSVLLIAMAPVCGRARRAVDDGHPRRHRHVRRPTAAGSHGHRHVPRPAGEPNGRDRRRRRLPVPRPSSRGLHGDLRARGHAESRQDAPSSTSARRPVPTSR